MASLETVRQLLTLARVYPNQPTDLDIRQTIMAEWVRILADVPDELACAAYDEWSKSAERFAPPPGALRTRAIELAGVDTQTRAEEAWFKIADSRYGRDPIDDSLVIEVVRLIGGFDVIGNTDTDRMHYVQDRFIKLYSERAGRTDTLAMIGSGRALLGGGNVD